MLFRSSDILITTSSTSTMYMKTYFSKLLPVILLLAIALPAGAQNDILGTWSGKIELPGVQLGIQVDFWQDSAGYHGTIDIPQQGAYGLPLRNVYASTDSVYFVLPAGPGLATFSGIPDGDVITGDFSQAGIRVPFSLDRIVAGSGGRDAAQEQKPGLGQGPESAMPKPYSETEVEVQSGDIRLACSITRPLTGSSWPGIILITGSGPQDRDETIFGFKPFLILAEHLTPQGYIVMRCDDRGTGKSGGNLSTSTSADLAGDVVAMMDFLLESGEIERDQIGLLGHSEGGLIAAHVAALRPETAFVIKMAGPALPGHEIIRAQSTLIMQSMGADNDAIARQDSLLTAVFRAIETDEGWDGITQSIRDEISGQLMSLTPEQREAFPDPDAYIEAIVQQQLSMMQSNWYRYFIQHDPGENLQQLTMPVLAVFGELDLQVPAELNAKALDALLIRAGNTKYTIQILPGANHLFQKAVTGSPNEYATLEKSFIDGFLDSISQWLAEINH